MPTRKETLGFAGALPDTAVVQTKTEAIRDLGFSPKQVERFETLTQCAGPSVLRQGAAAPKRAAAPFFGFPDIIRIR